MRRFFSVLLVVFLMFSFTACNDGKKPAEGVYESENAEFTVKADKTEIYGETDRVTITVEATAKKSLYIELGTGSYEEKGAVIIQCYTKQGDVEYVLYDDLYGVDITCDMYEFDFIKGNTITRTLKFSRFPISYSDETTKVMPKGEYRVRVKLQCDEIWTETDIVINAKEIFESENAKFTVKADKTSIKGETDQVTIIVEATVKNDFDSGITYGTEKNTCMVIECYMQTNGKEYKLYNDYDSLPHPEPVMDFHFEKGEIVERTLLFSRLPLIDSIDYQTVPQGKYKVRIRFNGEKSWTETDIIINAK